jgi:hypothetical protein
MVNVHQVHRSSDTWERDITLLACILRLRCQPPVPYEDIADVLLTLLPAPTRKLAERLAPHDIQVSFLEHGIRTWLTDYLQNVFENAELLESKPWMVALAWSRELVGAILSVTKSNLKGHSVIEDDEMGLQIRWRKENDWRAGSTPLGRPQRVNIDREGSVLPLERRSNRQMSWEPIAPEVQRGLMARSLHDSFADQLEEVRLVEESVKGK